MKPEETIDYHLKSTWLRIVKMYNSIASEYQATQGIGMLLINIDEEGTFVTDLGPRSGIDKTSLARIMKSMEDQGLIVRIPDTQDRRKVLVKLTEEGAKKRKIARKVVRAFNELILSKLNKSEKDTFFKVMEKINQSIEEFKKQTNEKKN